MCKIRLVLKVAECYIICFIKAEYAEQKNTIFIHVYTSDYNNNEQYESVANNKTNFNCNHMQLVYQRLSLIHI